MEHWRDNYGSQYQQTMGGNGIHALKHGCLTGHIWRMPVLSVHYLCTAFATRPARGCVNATKDGLGCTPHCKCQILMMDGNLRDCMIKDLSYHFTNAGNKLLQQRPTWQEVSLFIVVYVYKPFIVLNMNTILVAAILKLRWALVWENTDICHVYTQIYIYIYIYISLNFSSLNK